MEQTVYPERWNLDSLYAGGSKSAAFASELAGMETDIDAVTKQLKQASSVQDAPSKEELSSWTAQIQSVLIRLRQTESFVSCLLAQQMKDTAAIELNDKVKTIAAKFNSALTLFDEQLMQAADGAWEEWLQTEEASPVAFVLRERRATAKEKLAPAMEALAGELAVDGYHGWGDFYNTIVSRTRFRWTAEDGTEQLLSAGQMHNKLSDGNREVRAAAFAEWEREWGEQAELCAEVLNRLAGFRLKWYEKRGWPSVMKEPLQMNRMSEATLAAMWKAVEEGKPALVRYLERKAQLLGVEKLDWHDVEAPIGTAASTVPYSEGAAFIMEQFRRFSAKLADFSAVAFRDGWIEAEDRPGKRPGGFCTAFPLSNQTRIFMTYSGTASNVSTLAHELGHAYHQHVMDGMPPFAQEYAMNVAETASTFAELIVSDSAMVAAADPQERLVLLEDKLQRSTAFFMNIHARYLFERRFYEQRRNGMVDHEQLCKLMEEAQREAFCGVLGDIHPHFWASKLHFYLTDVPFYNFPYTFGFLFSSGIYAIAKREGAGFSERYDALLRDTGIMTVEELAEKHLGVRLDEPEFWRGAVALMAEDVEVFLQMTDK
ncbi:M3 family oligoendopeptidase [Paenibacillus sp. GCM10027626]|uniref:M3 family oligoendopeptidase n=1 Tax=Paenibacillus sp. GCM10027626 TaxID=3273411 RepID=UPI003635DF51